MTMTQETKQYKVLVVYYSQSGQLEQIVQSIVEPLATHEAIQLTWEQLKPVREYPFPWPILKFLDVFPESIELIPPALQPTSFDPDAHFDLVILAYQVWYLAPSLPVTAFLTSSAARILNGKPVITVVNCRDKWIMAQETVKQFIAKAGGKLIDNVVVSGEGNPFTQLVTSLRWLWTGKRNRFWKIFPPAGISASAIEAASRFGHAIVEALSADTISSGSPVLRGLGAVRVDPELLQQEKVAYFNFKYWGRWIRRCGKPGSPSRWPLLGCFALYLFCLLVVSFPIAVVVKLVINPLRKETLAEQAQQYEEPSGSSRERIPQAIIASSGEKMTGSKEKAVFISGASSGIGKACALAMDRAGYRVFAGVRKEAAGNCLQLQTSGRITPVVLDITDSGQIAAAVASVHDALGDEVGLDGLVNNAGIVVSGPLEFLPIEGLRQQLEVNLIGHVAVTQAFLPLILKTKGRIVNIGSTAAFFAAPYLGAYAASKFAMEAITDTLRRELMGRGISVSVVEPGYTETPIWDKGYDQGDRLMEQLPEHARNLYQGGYQKGRKFLDKGRRHAISPKKIAAAVQHALGAERPKIRYVVGLDAHVLHFTNHFFPARLGDWFVKKFLGH